MMNTLTQNYQSGDRHKAMRGNLIILIILLIASTAYYSSRGVSDVSLSLEDDSITVNGPEDFAFSLPYEEIASLEFIESLDAGTAILGGTKSKCQYGTWENDSWGQYLLCARTNISCGILLTAKDGSRYCFNYESAETTTTLYTALSELLSEYHS